MSREMPHNIEAEKAVLGGVFVNAEKIDFLAEALTEDDFYRESHKLVFRAMLNMAAEKVPIDMVTIIERLRKEDNLEKAGGLLYVSGLGSSVPTAANMNYYAKIVKVMSKRRALIRAGEEIASSAYDATTDDNAIFDDAEKKVLAITTIGGNAVMPWYQCLSEWFDSLEKRAESAAKGEIERDISSGFGDIDKTLGGLKRQNLIILAGRPATGKTALALNIATHVAKKGQNVLFFSLEMSYNELVNRIIAAESRVSSRSLQDASIEQGEWDKIYETAGEIEKMPLYIDDTAGNKIDEIRGKARRLKAEKGLDLIVIDYLQLIRIRDTKRYYSREQEVAEISRSCKLLAKELDVPVIVLTQLNREIENRASHIPQLADLRESGAIEQDADVVGIITNASDFNKDAENLGNVKMLSILKNRHGATEGILLNYVGDTLKFTGVDITDKQALFNSISKKKAVAAPRKFSSKKLELGKQIPY